MTPTVALLHGFTGSPNSFRSVAAMLAERGVRVETPRLLGHGADDDADVHDFEGEVERLARTLGVLTRPLHLVGYSLGGRVAIGLLCRHPELLSGVTLVSAQPGLAAVAARLDRRTADEVWCGLLETRGVPGFVDAWEKLPLFATQASLPARVLAEQRAERLSHTCGGLVRSLRACGLAEMPSYWGELASVNVPTTLMVGAHDAKFVAIAGQMRERMRGAALEVIPGVGHNVVLERPAAVADVVSRAVMAGT